MADRPRRRSRASRQGNSGTRFGEAVSRPEDGNHHVLRRWIPVGADGGRGAKDGLSQRPLAHRRLQGYDGGGLADEKRRTMKKRESKIEDGGWRARSVLECGSPLPLLEGVTVSFGFQSARGLAQSKTLRILVLLCLLTSTFILSAWGQYSINRSEEHTSELRHLGLSYAVFCLKKKKYNKLPHGTRNLLLHTHVPSNPYTPS